MKIFYDTEFIEDGRTIDLISIGMVAEDGREYYAVSEEFSPQAVLASEWLIGNVVPSLPLKTEPGRLVWDKDHADWGAVKNRAQIAVGVQDFILATPDPQLWAWYAAYDHVALCQLWGPMISLPEGVPMFTCDLKQECLRLGDPQVPQQAEGEHNALADARHNRVIDEFLRKNTR